MNPLREDNKIKYGDKSFNVDYLTHTLASEKIFSKEDISKFNRVSRHGYYDFYGQDIPSKEYLFFTKPDLHIFGEDPETTGKDKEKNKYVTSNYYYDYSVGLNSELKNIPLFTDAYKRNGDALRQLQYSVKDHTSNKNPFMYLLTNSVTSSLELPSITADTKDSTQTIMGTSIEYRGHSFKSNNGYDFTLSFKDNANLDVYMLIKAYDEYLSLQKMGEVTPFRRYIFNRILPEQFSIYKFIIGADGETILYYAKVTGCYFTDVPRGEFGDLPTDGFKYSVSLHGQFVEDSNPMILEEFNRTSPGRNKAGDYTPTFNTSTGKVDNRWVRWPVIVPVTKSNNKYTAYRGTGRDYKLRWFYQ